MTFTRLFSTLLASALLASSLHAWTSSLFTQGMPQCDDKEVQNILQNTLRDTMITEMRKEMAVDDMLNDAHEGMSQHAQQAYQLIESGMKINLKNFTTERKDENRKRVTCTADMVLDIDRKKLYQALDHLSRAMVSKMEIDFDEFIEMSSGSLSEYERELNNHVDELASASDQHPIHYTARRTDDGKLLVEIEQ